MNAGFTYQINIGIIGDSPLNRLLASLDKINTTLDIIERNTHQTSNAITRMASSGNAAVSGLGGSFGNLIGTIGGTAVAMKGMHDAMAMQGASRAIDFASGGAVEGAKNMSFLRDTIDKMGLPMKESMEGFKTLDASIYGTGLSQQFARDMFQNTAMATTVLGVSADKTQNAFLAIGQMASKGVVSMEELRGQLGDSLPGAASIAARSMGMTIPTFNKMVESGNLLAKDFLPKFSAELAHTFQDALPGAVNSAQANFNRFNTSIADLSITFGEKLLPPVVSFMQNYLIPAAHWMGEHIDLMEKWAINVGVLYGSWQVYSTVAEIAAWRTAMLATNFAGLGTITMAQSIANIGLTSTIWAMTSAMLMNPVTWIAAGIIALGGAVYYAYTHSQTFRATLSGLWSAVQHVGHSFAWAAGKVWDFAKSIYEKCKPALEIFAGLLYKYWIEPMKTVLGWLWDIQKAFYDFTGISTAFNEGFDSRMMEEHFGSVIPKINETTKAVLGLDAAYVKLNESTVALAAEKQKQKDFLWNNNYANKSPMVLQSLAGQQLDKNNKPIGAPDDKIQKGINNITGGGKQTRIITFNNVKVGERIEIHTTNMKEGASEAAELVRREFLQLLNSANQAQ